MSEKVLPFTRWPWLAAAGVEGLCLLIPLSLHLAESLLLLAALEQNTPQAYALAAGAEFYRRARELEAGVPKQYFRLLNFGKFQSGTVRNALSAHTHLEGSLRAFQEEIVLGLRGGLLDIAADIEKSTGCTVQVKLGEGYPAIMNPADLYARVREALSFRELAEPSMTTEDFSWYQQYLPGMFFFLGLGDTPALHADTFDFDETILLKGADFFEELAEKFL